MRVLHFYKTYKPDSMGGVEELIWQICTGAARLGVQSDVLTPSRDTSTVDFGSHRHFRAKLDFEIASSGFSVAAFARFKALARQADVIHYHFPWPFMDVVHFATRARKPTVVTYHSDIVRQKRLLRFYRPLQRRFLDSATRIVATSPNYLDTSPVLAPYADKVEVIPIGLDRHAYPAPAAAKLQEWRERVGPKFFLFVGNLRYYKGLHILLDAIAGTGLPVVIVGQGPEENRLKEQARRLDAREVRFVGALPDLDKVALLQLCHAFVFPSHLRSEAFGISLLEAAMFGKPLISTELGTGTSYINRNGETGIVVPPEDATALRNAMTVLWNDPLLAGAMGQRGKQRFDALFTADRMVEKYVALYRGLQAEASLPDRRLT